MKLLFTEMGEEDAQFICQHLPGHEVRHVPDVLSNVSLGDHADVDVVSVMVHSKVGVKEMQALPNLKLIATRSTGFDHIDLAEAASRGIIVCTVPAYGSNTVAEHTFALMLALSRKVHKAYLRTLQGEFKLEGMMGFDLSDKVLGVVGVGKIGQHVVRIGRGFGTRVLAFDPFADHHLSELLGFRHTSFDQLLHDSDVVAVCCPLNETTKHLFDRAAFYKMKRGALLVNTARGAIVDSSALLWALNEGILSGAGLDVLEGEEMMGEDALVSSLVNPSDEATVNLIAENLALMRHPNLIVTPHMAFYSREALQRILETTVANVQAYEQGAPSNTVELPEAALA
jgi:D-lactate dehydrogenase